MLTKFIQSLEDPRKPLLAPNYWMLTKTGLILPPSKIKRTIYITIHEIVTLFVFTQFMELYVIRSNLDLVLTNLKISMLSCVCIVKSNTCVAWQHHWIEVIEYITKADKEERDNANLKRSIILEKYTKYCRFITGFYWVLVFSTFITVTHTPVLQFVSSRTFRENLLNGTEPFPHIFSSWMPFDKYHSPGCWITVVWHAILCAYGAALMAAYDIGAVVMMVYFGGKLDLLRERCKDILGTDYEGVSDDEAINSIRKLHNSHVLLVKYSKLFNSLLSPVMFFYMVMCSLMLCASAFQLTSANDTAQMILMAEYLIFGVAQLFLFCWHSNVVLYKSQRVSEGPYESAWYKASIRQRRCIVLLLAQLQKRVFFTAGPFTNLTLSTFITILKGAYSYYTLLRK
uniref:Odorant receptor n=1 Tax=Conopomorpha sinensis TaxID=940481 RepID=A0A3S7SGP4_9NEOP|nr:putative odorant receptor 29 [Conopomorpha sinensis]